MNSSRADGLALEVIPVIPWEEVHVQMSHVGSAAKRRVSTLMTRSECAYR
jgi:hypothetical protein